MWLPDVNSLISRRPRGAGIPACRAGSHAGVSGYAAPSPWKNVEMTLDTASVDARATIALGL